MDFELETRKLTKKGVTVSRPVCILTIIGVLLAFIALILGLTLGLRKNCEDSDKKSFEDFLELSCRNLTVLESKLKNFKMFIIQF